MQIGIPQSHAGRRARCQVLHQHIGGGDQLLEHRQRAGLLQVQRQAFLGAVDPHEMRRQAIDPLVIGPGKVAHARALHLDDPGPQVRQLAGAKRRGNRVFQGNNGDAVQRPG